MCVFVCACVVCVCVSACVRERDRDRERDTDAVSEFFTLREWGEIRAPRKQMRKAGGESGADSSSICWLSPGTRSQLVARIFLPMAESQYHLLTTSRFRSRG